MGKKRKKSTAHRVPPLSKLDKAIYTAIAVLLVVLSILAIFGWIQLHDRIAFRDPAVIAYDPGSSDYAALPLFLLLFLVAVITLGECFAGHHPLFGNKTIRYGDYPWKTDIFPLFGPQHRTVRRKASDQQFRAKMIRFLIGALVVTILFASLGIYGRTCLRDDRTIVKYSPLNRPGEPVSIARDCERITVKADLSGGRTTYWEYGVILYSTDGEHYMFMSRDFDLRHRGHTDCLKHLLAIKALFSSDQITFQGTELLPDVIEDNHLDEAQTALLEALFAPP